MKSTILSFLVVAAVAALTADAVVFGIPMSGVWRNFRGGSPFNFNFMGSGEQGNVNGIKFVPAMVAPAATASPATANNAPVIGAIGGMATGNNFVPASMFGGMGPGGFAFQF